MLTDLDFTAEELACDCGRCLSCKPKAEPSKVVEREFDRTEFIGRYLDLTRKLRPY